MVEHVVIFCINDADASSLENLHNELYSLSSLPSVSRLVFGKDHILTRAKGYTHGLVTSHSSKEAAAAYQSHPEHIRVRDKVLLPLVDKSIGVLSMDFEASPTCRNTERNILLGTIVVLLGYLFIKRN